MSAEVKRVRRMAGLAMSLCLLALCAVWARAAQNGQVMSYRVTSDSIALYVRHPDGDAQASATVGNEPLEVAIEGADSPLPTVTWVLVDNSKSTSVRKDRIEAILSKLFLFKSDAEKINLCTFAEGLHTLREESVNRPDLTDAVQNEISYRDQYTYLADVLQEVLTREQEKKRREYVRVFVICDGADNNPRGISLETLSGNMADFNIPIYIVGCGNDNAALRTMAQVSYKSGAQYWDMDEIDPEQIASAMRWDEMPIRAEIRIPEEMRDGLKKQVEIVFSDGVRARTEALAPSKIQPTPPPVPSPDPVPPQSDPIPTPEADKTPWWAILLIVLLVLVLAGGAAATVMFCLRRRGDADEFQPVGGARPQNREIDRTIDLEREDESGWAGKSAHHTLDLLDNQEQHRIILTDVNDSGRFFEEPLRKKVRVGRDRSNDIVIDYDKSVSGIHCEISVEGDGFKVKDLGSRNGTFVNEVEAPKRGKGVEIETDSVLRLGGLEFKVEIQ